MDFVAAVVVTYYPSRRVFANLIKLSSMVPHLVVVDNTPADGIKKILDVLGLDVQLISNPKNLGLAHALNQGINKASELGAKYVFLFDQDTTPPDGYCPAMIDFMKYMDSRFSSIAFFVPNFFDRNCLRQARFPVVKRFSFRHVTCESAGTDGYIVGNILAITSGTLLPLNRYFELGPFCDNYFIDFIDNEYCLRACANGLSIAVNCEQTIEHAIGKRKSFSFFGIRVTPNNHSPLRRYYIFRNGIYTALLYFRPFPSFSFLLFLRLIHELLGIILYESNKSKKIFASFRGALNSIKS